jgi:hypothetical protein
VKIKSVLLAAILATLISSAQTNRIIYKITVVTNWCQAPDNFRRFGNEVYDTSKYNWNYIQKERVPGLDPATGFYNASKYQVVASIDLFSIDGNIRSLHGQLVLLDIRKLIPGRVLATASTEGNARIGAFSAAPPERLYAPDRSEYDKTIVLTNYSEIKTATINQKIRVNVKRIGVITMDGQPLEFYDCGAPWIYRVVSTNRIALKQ